MSVQPKLGTLESSTYAPGLISQTAELTRFSPSIDGYLPEWLCGRLIRTVPSLFEAGQTNLRHWFDGLATLYSFEFGQAKIHCQSRILHSQAYEKSLRLNRLATSEFATNPRLSLPEKLQALVCPTLTDNGNVNVARIGDHYVALTEIPKYVEFNPATLETLGRLELKGRLGLTTAAAHPHCDPACKSVINLGTRIGPRSSYVVYETLPDTSQRVITSIPVGMPGYIHSFAVTPKYVIIFEFPLLLQPLDLLLSGKPYIENFRWLPERGSRILIVSREERKLAFVLPAPAVFAFHHVNAFEQAEGRVAVDALVYHNAGIINALYLDKLRLNQSVPSGRLTRYNINLPEQSVEISTLCENGLELPRINYGRCNGQNYRFAWCAGSTGETNFLDHLIKMDLVDGNHKSWTRPGCYPGEPVFVPKPGAQGEDDGVLLSLVLDTANKKSFLLVLDAQSMDQLTQAFLPIGVPLGFHGQFWPTGGDN